MAEVTRFRYLESIIQDDGEIDGDVNHRIQVVWMKWRRAITLMCFGVGCCPSKRVSWCRELMDEEADQFLSHPFIDPEPDRPWLAQRMALRIPFSA
ncbi:hypothetical protein Lal_00018882 [Lupinus albus]|nr:hypothetical protein Lal_00018882 [Lupinus albus]